LAFPGARRLVPGSSIPRAGSPRRHVPIVFFSCDDSVPCVFSLGLGFVPPPAGGFLSRFSSLGCSKRRNRLTGFAVSDLPHSIPARPLHAARLAHRSSWGSLFFVSSSERQFSACLPHHPRPSLFKPQSSLPSGSSLSKRVVHRVSQAALLYCVGSSWS
jgi:hypothetical protein